MRSARTGEPVDPVRDHLDKAENWLELAEGNRGELVSLHEGTGTYTEAEDTQRWYFAIMLESAKDLAELHRAMAQTIYDLTPQRIVVSAPTPADMDNLAERIREQVAADEVEHQAATLRPGVDPEPPGDGELWTDDGERFAFSVNSLAPGADVHRWMIIDHYAEFLRWRDQNERRATHTWEGLDGKIGWADEMPLRRPTAAERTAFYGPEPDPVPAPGHTGRVFDLSSLGDDDLRVLAGRIAALLAPVDRLPGSGATQWREG